MTTAPPAVAHVRPSLARLTAEQTRYAVLELWRARLVLVLTLLLPLLWLVAIGLLAGNDVVDERTGLRVMQYATPVAVAMGVLYGAFPTVASSLAQARETRVLTRLRGTPLPPAAYVAGRVLGGAAFATSSALVTLAVGVAVFDVQVVWRTAAATVVTLALAVATFASLGLAVAVLGRSASATQAASIGGAVALTFVSGLFTFGGTSPGWMRTVADVLPLRPFADALGAQLDPSRTGAGWDVRALATTAAWGLGAAAVAALRWRSEPRTAEPSRRRWGAPGPGRGGRGVGGLPGGGAPGRGAPDVGRRSTRAPDVGRRSTPALLADQVRAAATATARDPGTVVFAIVVPVALYTLMVSTQRGAVLPDGRPLAVGFAAGMAAWGTAVVAFMNLPEALASARDRGVLKRLRGTPLPLGHHVAGRLVVAVGAAWVLWGLLLAVARAAFGVDVDVVVVVRGLLTVTVGAVSLAACGLAVAALAPSARAFGALSLAVLLPLAFLSDVFVVGAPAWMRSVGSLFPLRHLQNALVDVWPGPGAGSTAVHLGVLLLWAVGAGAVALRSFRWSPPD